jgi:hypothetical protein
MNDMHIYIPAEFTGTVHLHLGSEAADAELTSDNGGGKATVEEVLARFEAYTEGTHVRSLVSALVATGWKMDTHPNGKYIRAIYNGDIIRPVSALINSVNLTHYNSAVKPFAALIEGADVRSNGSVVFGIKDGIDLAVTASKLIARYADGNISTPAQYVAS